MKFSYFLFLIILITKNYSIAYAKESEENKARIYISGDEILKKLHQIELLSTDKNDESMWRWRDNNYIWNNKTAFDPTKKYFKNPDYDLCPHQWSFIEEIDDCDKKTKICTCQNQEVKNDENPKFGALFKYYKNDNMHCQHISSNYHSCFFYQDDSGKFATIIPSKYDLKPTNNPDDYQKEFFLSIFEGEENYKVSFYDEKGVCGNAEQKFDEKTKKTYIDCASKQEKN